MSRFSKKKAPVNNVELQYNKAMNLMDNGDSEESVKILEQVADIGIMDTQYKSYGDDALLALAEFMKGCLPQRKNKCRYEQVYKVLREVCESEP